MQSNGDHSPISQTPDITIKAHDEAFVTVHADGGTFREVVDYFTFEVRL